MFQYKSPFTLSPSVSAPTCISPVFLCGFAQLHYDYKIQMYQEAGQLKSNLKFLCGKRDLFHLKSIHTFSKRQRTYLHFSVPLR
jgi:hypothetical protein